MNLKKQCYKLFQVIVVERDPYCRRPGCTKPATSGHHVFGRNKMGTAFETDSGMGLCLDDHDGWARECPGEVREVLRAMVGDKRFEELVRLSNETCRWRDADFHDYATRMSLELVELREKKREAGE
jgi:hypothetical protein